MKLRRSLQRLGGAAIAALLAVACGAATGPATDLPHSESVPGGVRNIATSKNRLLYRLSTHLSQN